MTAPPDSASAPVSLAQEARLLADPSRVRQANLSLTFTLLGLVDEASFQAAVGALIEAHPALRTNFYQEDSEWRQRVLPCTPELCDSGVSVSTETSGTNDALTTSRTEELVKSFVAPPFDIGAGKPLIRALLLRTAQDQHKVVLVVDHLAADEWSMRVVARHFFQSYQAAARGDSPALPATSEPAAMAAAERRSLMDGTFARELSELAALLSGVSPYGHLDLPVAAPLSDFPVGRTRVTTLPVERKNLRLLRRASGTRLTDLMLVSALFAAVVRLELPTDAVPVISHTANRQDPDLENVVGWLSNTVVVPLAVHPDDSLLDVLSHGHTSWLDAIRLARVPGRLVRQSLSPEGLDGRVHAPSILVRHQESATREWDLDGVTVVNDANLRKEPELGGVGPRGRLEVRVVSSSGEVDVQVVYEEGRFPEAMMERITTRFGRLLLNATDISTRPVRGLASPLPRLSGGGEQ
ncbi:condensation domain-containing protein [Streptacidiphilus sp. P02-A3a]|uniref:condensation domain-containing protein n=1 Tax=Streptacidiphilus sp. P02-A3a TaxID=2704468 RepID=UPI0015FDDED1|nr:condensation domain-containing protein [Streptacidiphilus sp. P02-A3a]QMU67191.1 hypothetical protein GXP74_02180 [Streptacidiphilus sp. P02-A3a]